MTRAGATARIVRRRRSRPARSAGFGLVLASALATGAPAEVCDRWHGIWARDTDDGRWIVYFADVPVQTAWNTFFELWRDDARVARIRGNFHCANGIEFCNLGIEAISPAYWPEAKDPRDPATRDDPEDPIVFWVPVDTAGETGGPYFDSFELAGARPDWLIFAHLTQNFFAQQRFSPPPTDTIRIGPTDLATRDLLLPPSSYRFFGCRDGAHGAEPFDAPDPFFGP